MFLLLAKRVLKNFIFGGKQSMKNMKCAVYIRTNKEATNTNSIQNQISFLENYINNQGLELYNIYSDISAGSTLKRPGIRKLMEDAKEKKFDIILVKDLTRIARNAELTQQFIKFIKDTNKLS